MWRRRHGTSGKASCLLICLSCHGSCTCMFSTQRPSHSTQQVVIAKPTLRSDCKPTDAQEPSDFPERSLHCRYKFTEANCIHGKGCKNLKEGRDCRIGMRLQRTQLITGAHQDSCTLPTPCRMRSSCLAAQCKRCPQARCSACMHASISFCAPTQHVLPPILAKPRHGCDLRG